MARCFNSLFSPKSWTLKLSYVTFIPQICRFYENHTIYSWFFLLLILLPLWKLEPMYLYDRFNIAYDRLTNRTTVSPTRLFNCSITTNLKEIVTSNFVHFTKTKPDNNMGTNSCFTELLNFYRKKGNSRTNLY